MKEASHHQYIFASSEVKPTANKNHIDKVTILKKSFKTEAVLPVYSHTLNYGHTRNNFTGKKEIQ
ncbi:hypothetical protein [Methanosarcina siciliae]|uniref:hypothetical protein n=1 Tax=Methanosarcina siciliae TaxID=38027 RepID=UPI00064E5C0F|nr:hypothetical protein [Methanosarcina siciliae]